MENVIERQTYTVAEAARILGISRALAYRVLPTIDLEGRRLVSRHVIDRMLAPDDESDGGRRPPDKFSGDDEPKIAQTAGGRGSNRAAPSAPPSSRTPRRRHDDIGRASQ
jgi:hypothetical protein